MSQTNRNQEQARHLVRTLLLVADEQACQACYAKLEAYVELQLAGADYMAHMPEVAQRLDQCVACAEAYALLYEACLMEATLPEPAHVPLPDVSFLQPGAPGPLTPAQLRAHRAATTLRERIATAVSQVGTTLRLTLTQDLLEAIISAPRSATPTLLLRDRSSHQQPYFELTIEAPTSAVEWMRLTAYCESRMAERCTLRLQLALAGRIWPDLAGIPLQIRVGAMQRQLRTDAWGEAIVTDVPMTDLPTLQLELDTDNIPPIST